MKLFQKPLWWLFILILPSVLLLISELSVFSILDSELKEPANFKAWYTVMGLQGFIILSSLAYLVIAFRKGMKVHWAFPLLIFITEISFIALLSSSDRELIPWSVPNWMVDDDEFILYHIALAMPSVFFALVQLVSYSIKEDQKQPIWKSILIVIAIPAFWYCFFLIGLPLYRYSENYELIRMIEHALLVIGIIMTAVFFYFLIRTLILLSIRSQKTEWLRILIVVLTTLVFPIAGLIVNDYSDDLIPGFDSHIFGDFSHWLFYALTITNGILLLLPTLKDPRWQRLTVALRFALLPFTLYFLLVFIPFLPLSIIGILFFGLGFLVLSPVLMFVFNVHRIVVDISNKEIFPDLRSVIIVVATVLVLPVLITLNFWLDKQDLKKAMAYVYEPDYSQKEISIDKNRLKQVLEVIAANGSNTNLFRGKAYWKPYLSTYYRWLVLDNLTLSGKKMSELERIFIGSNEISTSDFRRFPDSDSTRILKFHSETKKETGFNSTWIHLELENTSEQQQEYEGRIKLPEGAYIRNYYLDVNDKRKYGTLAERKTAQWVYNNIVSFRRDPGLLTYANQNTYNLKVFPLDSHQIRKTGIEIIHQGDLKASLEGTSDILAVVDSEQIKSKQSKSVFFISESEKQKLPQITRKPLVYFLLNNSVELSDSQKVVLADKLENEIRQSGLNPDSYEMCLVNHSIKTIDKNKWREEWMESSSDGGYFADRAVRAILVEHYRNASLHVPVFVFVSNNGGAYPSCERDLYFTFPDYTYSYRLSTDGLYQYKVQAGMDEILSSDNGGTLASYFKMYPVTPVRCWPDAKAPKYFLPEQGSSVLLTQEEFTNDLEDLNSWEKAAVQLGNARYLSLHPEEMESKWRMLLKQNFETGILSPFTAYMVVETEAQEEVLRQKQKQVMNAAPSMDIEQGFVSMSEPSWMWYALGGIVLIVWSRRKSSKYRVRSIR